MTTLRCNMIFILACHSCSTQGQIDLSRLIILNDPAAQKNIKSFVFVRVHPSRTEAGGEEWKSRSETPALSLSG